MCGIVGIRRFDGAPVDEALLHTMAAQLVHRGPDGAGTWVGDGVGFGHRRLSIIDLAGSPQPMASADERYHVTFNGEIFNYRDLRRTIDYPYRTSGDTEVLLAGWARAGAASVDALRGQFAFAMHDAVTRDLWLVRDRAGVLPLYYHADARRVVFASEIKALLPALAQVQVDEASLGEYLAHRSVPAPHTLFAGVRKVLPGHVLHVRADGVLVETPYWQVPSAAASLDVPDAEAVARLERALDDAVDLAHVADVPVGAYLSGGLDSSLIVALAAARRGDGAPVETFSAGFGDPRHDETGFAREVSTLLGTRHHQVDVTADDFRALWPALTWHRDAPISEPADVAVFRLAELARTRVKVVLSGEGSDELFAGYPKYRVARALRAADVVPGRWRARSVAAVERHAPPALARARIALRAAGASTEAERFQTWFAPFTPAERAALLGRPERRPHEQVWQRAGGDVVQRMLYVDFHAWLPDNLLERGDRMSMAASLELRPPFLDHRLVELAFALPSRFKVRGTTTKWLVKQVARRHLPAHIVDRRKVGFRVPLDAWFRSGLREMASDRLLSRDAFVGQVMDRAEVAALLERHDQARANEEMRIWTLLCLEVWHDVFFRTPRTPALAVPRP